jgi:peptide/nickel transport system permease protein
MSEQAASRTGAFRRFLDHDLVWSLRSSPTAIVAAVITALLFAAAIGAPLIAPQDPFDLAAVNLLDSERPPVWLADGLSQYVFGTDTQGRDILSLIIYGLRISLVVGFMSVAISLFIGVSLGLWSGYAGGWADTIIMRAADVKLSFPTILVALLINGAAKTLLPRDVFENSVLLILVFSIGISGWVPYARVVRGLAMIEKKKEYVQAARLARRSAAAIAISHILPNTLGPVAVIATINLALAILTEATLSFLGVGMPPTEPSLGTLVRVGNEYMLSGQWWVVVFPSLMLVVLILAVNLLGDWLRDALNPKLR